MNNNSMKAASILQKGRSPKMEQEFLYISKGNSYSLLRIYTCTDMFRFRHKKTKPDIMKSVLIVKKISMELQCIKN